MKNLLTLLTVALFTSGCASTPFESPYAPTERDLVAKTQYYEELNQRVVAELDEKLDEPNRVSRRSK